MRVDLSEKDCGPACKGTFERSKFVLEHEILLRTVYTELNAKILYGVCCYAVYFYATKAHST